MTSITLGWIGLGSMGSAIAKNIHKYPPTFHLRGASRYDFSTGQLPVVIRLRHLGEFGARM